MGERLAIHGGTPVRGRAWPDWPEHGEPERAALVRVLESRNWGGYPSPNTECGAFAAEFAHYVGSPHAVPCANGTFSLMLALQAGRVEPGSEVITTAYSFVGTLGGIVAAGCVPVLADVDPASWCVDPDAIEAAVTPRTAAVMPVHLACGMADMDRITDLCRTHGLLLVEDCAHAHGMRWRDRGAGSIGDFGSFSMQSTKLLTAGEGGCVTTNDALAAERLWSLVNCGRKEPGFDSFPEQMFGHNLRITEWQAAILRCQLERLPDQHRRRTERVEAFEAGLSEISGFDPMLRDPRVTARTSYQLLVRYDAGALGGVPRDHVILALRAEGIPCSGRFYVPLHADPLFAMDPHTNPIARGHTDYASQSFPHAERAAYTQSIWLPHELFLGESRDIDDLLTAFARITAGADALRERPPDGRVSRR